jgi:hypothetical protein
MKASEGCSGGEQVQPLRKEGVRAEPKSRWGGFL